MASFISVAATADYAATKAGVLAFHEGEPSAIQLRDASVLRPKLIFRFDGRPEKSLQGSERLDDLRASKVSDFGVLSVEDAC